jgi:hypothetical protein
MFEKSLTDLVKGIRTHKHNEDTYIRNCITEIKNELQTQDIKKKAVAVQKLTYVCNCVCVCYSSVNNNIISVAHVGL